MCIAVFIWQSHPLCPLLLFLNRDEFHNRPTEPLAWWGEDREIAGGRDRVAGGTWLACSRHGRLAFVTNFREAQPRDEAKSRGDLPVRFLQSEKSPMEFAEEIHKEADEYNGFNLVVADISSKSMVYITNRIADTDRFITEVSPGIHVLSNGNLDSPWPKCQRLHRSFRGLLDKRDTGDLSSLKEMADELMTDTAKDDESKLPQVLPPDIEYGLSSVFVDVRRPTGRYGTRSISALCVKADDEICFYERHLEEDTWEDRTVTFKIEN